MSGGPTQVDTFDPKPELAKLAGKKTLVIWGGEFGRTPTMEGLGKGRDHSPAAFSV